MPQHLATEPAVENINDKCASHRAMTKAGVFSSRPWPALAMVAALLLAAPAAADAAAPIVPSTSASKVTETSALFQGAVAPRQSSAEAHFEYVDQANYEASGFASASKTETLKVPLLVKGKGDLLGPVAATGDLSEGSPVITSLNISSGSFSAGQEISGEGIPSGASVKSLGSGTLTLTAPVEAGKSKTGVPLTGAASDKVTNLSTESGTFVPGQTISAKNGKGIKAGTSILAASADSLTLSQPATETIDGAELTATTTVAQGSGETEEGSVEILHVVTDSGTFLRGQILTGLGIRPGSRIEQVLPDEEAGKLKLKISRPAAADAEGLALTTSSPQPIAASISGLTPHTQYHLRVAAVDSNDAEATGTEVIFFTQAPSPTFPACPNDVFRSGELSPFGSPSARLSDCRSYEQASPVDKDGGDVQGDVTYSRAADDGSGVVFGSTFGAPGAEGAQELPFFLAQRRKDDSGWSSQGLQPPASLGEKGYSLRGWLPDFSATFASAIRLSSPITEAIYQLDSGGGAPTLVAPFAAQPGGLSPYDYAGVSADGQTAIFESQADLSGPGPTYQLLPGGARNLYAWDAATGSLTLVSTMNDGAENASKLPKGAHAGPYDWIRGLTRLGGAREGYYLSAEHAISDDGSVFFTSVSDGQLYQRLNPTALQSNPGPDGYVEDGHCAEPHKACTLHISATHKTNGGPDQDGTDPAGPQPAAFMAASADGSTSYFTSSEKLTDDANTGPEQPPAQVGVADLSDPDPDATKDEGLIPRHATGLAVDPKGEYIYWADPSRGTIGRAKLTADGSGTEGAIEDDFIAPGETEAITYPESEPGIYYSAPSRPRYVAVGPCAEGGECVYWTNTGPPAGDSTSTSIAGGPLEGGGTIGRAALTPDHSALEGELEAEFIVGATNPQGIAVNSEHIYWANAGREGGVRAIGWATIEGDEVSQSLIKVPSSLTPYGVALSGSHVYYSANNEGQDFAYIRRSPLEEDEQEVLFIGKEGIRGLAIDSEHLYWASQGEEAIGRSDLELTPTSQANEFIALKGKPTGLAVSGTNLYWSVNGEAPPNPGNDLYRYRARQTAGCSDPSGCLEDLTPLATGNGAEVQGVLGASDDGSFLYFVANGVLDDAEAAKPGNCHGIRGVGGTVDSRGTCNLYLWHEGEVEYIAKLNFKGSSGGDVVNLFQTPRELYGSTSIDEKTAFLSSDGRTLLFRSTEQLTDYDNAGILEYYLFRVGEPLVCVTCPPSGVAPSAAPTLNTTGYPGLSPNFGGASATPARHLSADGTRVFFQTTEALVSADVNGEHGCPSPVGKAPVVCQDVYQWEAPGSGSCTEGGPGWSQLNQGCIYLISTGKSAYPSFFIDASESGDDVFFITRDSLVGSDGDSITDVYDARVGGGLASQNTKPQPPCELEGCMPGATPPPLVPAPPDISGPPDSKPKRCKAKKCKKHHKPKKGRKRHKHHPKANHTGGTK